MAEHTGGDWYHVTSRIPKHKEAIFIKGSGVFVAKVYGHDGQPTRANTALIIAAPTMFDTLTAIRNELEAWAEYHELCNRNMVDGPEATRHVNTARNYQNLIDNADKALNKAKGGA